MAVNELPEAVPNVSMQGAYRLYERTLSFEVGDILELHEFGWIWFGFYCTDA